MKEKTVATGYKGIAQVVISLALLLALLGFTATAYAQGGGGSAGGNAGGSVTVQGDQDQDRDRDQVQDPTTHDGDEPDQDRDQDQDRLQDSTTGDQDRDRTQDQDQDQDRDQVQDPTTHDGDEPDQDRDQTQDRDQDRDRIHVEMEDGVVPAADVASLRNQVQTRERELEQDASDAQAEHQNIIRNENQVRLAVHALLAAENLLGPVGLQVAQIARQVNESVMETVNAEVQIQSRSFLRTLFWGGDREQAQVLMRHVEQNQMRIQEMQRLLNEVNLSAEVRVMLEAHLRLMEQEQERLRLRAEAEENQWGLFSWRF